MYIRLNNKLIDLRTVSSIERSDNSYRIIYDNEKTETITTVKKEPKDVTNLMEALITVFNNIEEWDETLDD